MNKTFRKVVLTALLSIGLSVGIAGAAIASTGGGVGGGTGSGTRGEGSWRAVWNSNGSAWNSFTSQGAQNSEGGVRDAGGQSLVNLCKRSQAIWWYAKPSSNELYLRYRGTRTLDDRATQIRNSSGVPSVWNRKAAEWTDPAVRRSTSAPYIVICSAAINTIENRDPVTRKWSTTRESESEKTRSFTHPYSYITTVTPQTVEGQRDPIGAPNLHAQPASAVKTEFGKLWDEMSRTGAKAFSPEELAKRVQAALAVDKTAEHAKVTLSEQNKAGMAEGGVLNVSEYRMLATLNSTATTVIKYRTDCTGTRTWNHAEQRYNKERKSCGRERETGRNTSYAMANGLPSQKSTGFWQMLSVHCNAKEFDALVNATGATVHNSGDPTRGLSAVAISKRYDARPTTLDFGDRRNEDAAAARSGQLGFFDKECGFTCTASPDPADGASSDNGATENSESPYGAVSEGFDGNVFNAFRDNNDRSVTLDVSYPVSGGVVSYDGDAPVSTTVVRDSESTPSVDGSDGGQMTMTATQGANREQLFADGDETAVQRNFSLDSFSNATGTNLEGLWRDFDYRATWASESDRPTVLNVKWEYRPQVATSIPAEGIGFSRGGALTTGKAVTVETAIDGQCYGYFGASGSDPIDTATLLQEHTGTGSTNGLDDGLAVRPEELIEAVREDSTLTLHFIRAVAH